MSEIATLAELGHAQTVLRDDLIGPGSTFLTIAEVALGWGAGGGTAHDQDAYGRARERVVDLRYEPELLFAPTHNTSSGWWMVDGIHRAAAYYNTRAAAGITKIHLRVFVMPRPVS